MKKIIFIIALLLLNSSIVIAAADETPADNEPAEAYSEQILSKLELSGSLDSRYSLLQSRKTSSLYKLQNFGQTEKSGELSQFLLEPYLNGDYVTKDIGFHFKTHSTYINEQSSTFELVELYESVNVQPTLTFLVGKKAYTWGKGYAFNAVGYVNPTKDSENPESVQAGKMSLAVDYTKSFDSGALQTLGLTFIVIPPSNVQNKYGEVSQTEFAAKTYFFVWDSDIDILAYKSAPNGNQLGIDFSTNILTNLEVHGEFSQFENVPKATINQNALSIQNSAGNSYLVGLRYLSVSDTTVIMEYYHNGSGLTADEFSQYVQYLDNSLAGGQSTAIQQALGTASTYFQESVIMSDYLYFKVSQPEPFNWVYFTPSVFVLYNIGDKSFSLGAPLSYKPFTNFEFVLWPTFLVGSERTQFGDKQFSQRWEAWFRFYF